MELARGLALAPRILLLDEPTAGMTPDEAEEVVRGICVLREHGYTVLVIEHRMDVIAGACDRVIVLDHGEKIADGTPREVVANPEVIHAYLGTGGGQDAAKEAVGDSTDELARDGQGDAGADAEEVAGMRIERPGLPDEHSYACNVSPVVVSERMADRERLHPTAEPILELRGVHSSVSYTHLDVYKRQQVDFMIGFSAGMKAFTAAVLGGIGNIRGAMAGGLVLGLAESLGVLFLAPVYKDVIVFSVLIAVLILRPQGILGKPVDEKV